MLYRFLTDQLSVVYDRREARTVALMLMSYQWPEKNDAQLMLMEYDKELMKELEVKVERLVGGEPIQYVIGQTDFCGLTLYVESGVLIPRPETEGLVSLIERKSTGNRGLNILDIGTGSGCIALSLKHRYSEAVVEAWDVSEAALSIARKNAVNNGLEVMFHQIDILDDRSTSQCNAMYDIIVSNPPYIAEKERKDMEHNVLDYEPSIALFVPDDDPLMYYRAISQFGVQHLNELGLVAFEINQQYGRDTVRLLQDKGYQNVELHKDQFLNDRYVTAIWRA